MRALPYLALALAFIASLALAYPGLYYGNAFAAAIGAALPQVIIFAALYAYGPAWDSYVARHERSKRRAKRMATYNRR